MDTTLARPREGLRPRGQRYLENLLSGAGIEINGGRPYDMRVLDDRIFTRALTGGIEGLLDGYVQGWWETDRFDELTARVLSNAVSLPESSRTSLLLASLAARLFNLHTRRRTLKLRKHYDLGNDLFEAMLDPRLVYSCAYWKNASTLEEAQEAKLDLIAKKIGLKPGMRVLDIGCGWGGFAKFVAERYGVSVVAITIAKEQYKLAKSRCEGLPVEVRLQDYRDLRETPFDAVVSIAMFEAVGFKNYSHFMKIVRRHLKPDGLFLLHTIGGNVSSVTGKRMGRAQYLPRRHAAIGETTFRRRRGSHGHRRLAQFRGRLRQDSARLVSELRSELASAARQIWRSLLPDVEVLLDDFRRRFPGPLCAALAESSSRLRAFEADARACGEDWACQRRSTFPVHAYPCHERS